MFKVGDIVRCVDGRKHRYGYTPGVICGYLYVVENYNEYDDLILKGYDTGWSTSRFVEMKDVTKVMKVLFNLEE